MLVKELSPADVFCDNGGDNWYKTATRCGALGQLANRIALGLLETT